CLDERGVSLVLVHTPRGKELFDRASAQLVYREVPVEDCLQSRLKTPSPAAAFRDRFRADYRKHGAYDVIRKYGEEPFPVRVRRKLSAFVKKCLNRP
ncbi:MAG: hypothetical protein J6U26_05035, partial [Lachnospiraceae bacterium]|nr:hypothetical protein [Lachnospiraceae bacterium]